MSAVLATGLASPAAAEQFFAEQLKYRTDPSDLARDLLASEMQIIVIDTRSAAHYAVAHIPGAISFPHPTMSLETTAQLDRSKVYICYCDGIGCNGSTWGAYKMAKLGFQVKELIGGIHWWQQDGLAIAIGEEPGVLAVASIECSC